MTDQPETEPITREQLRTMTTPEIMAALDAGDLNHLLKGNQK